MEKCMLEKMDFSIENPLGFKRIECVTGIALNTDYPDTKTVSVDEAFYLDVHYSSGINGKAIITGEGSFVRYTDEVQPVAYYRDAANMIGNEQEFSNTKTFQRSDTPNTGIIVNNANRITSFSSAGIKYDTLDLIALSTPLTLLGLSNNDLEDVDFREIFKNCPNLTSVRLINGKANLDLKDFGSLADVEVIRIHNNNGNTFWFPYNGINANITGDIADMYVNKKLKRIDCQYTKVHGDLYELIQRYRINDRESGYITSSLVSRSFTFNGISMQKYNENIIVWDASHAYVATNTNSTSLTGKKKIYYVGYSDAEVEEMKQGLWSGLSDANIINCG